VGESRFSPLLSPIEGTAVFYYSVRILKGKDQMKKLVALLCLIVSSLALADDGTGYIVGFDLGTAQVNYQKNSFQSYTGLPEAQSLSHDQGLAYDIYLGYRLYRELGWEIGYRHYQTTDFNYATSTQSMKVKRYDYDFLMRGDYPIFSAWNVFAKLGVARVNSRFTASTNVVSNVAAWTPAYGVGTEYEVSDHTGINLQWLRVNQVKENVHSSTASSPDVPMVNYFSLGMMYRF